MRTRLHARWSGPLIALAALASMVMAQATPTAGTHGSSQTLSVARKTVDGLQEMVLTGPNGMTLYYSTRDTPDASRCTAGCAQTWSPLTVRGGAPTASPRLPGRLSTLARPSGREQVVYDGHPLYTYSLDRKPTDTRGAGEGSFQVATLAMSGGVRYAKTPALVGYIGGMTLTLHVETLHGNRVRVITAYDGRTLYYSTKDTVGASHCTGGCAATWKPFALVGKGKPTAPPTVLPHLSTLQRSGDVYQIEYNGHPLYTYAKDQRPGELRGAGVGSFRVATLATPRQAR